MSGIICAIRGGPASRTTIDKAIALAQASKQPLHFLYVINLDFLTRTSHSRTTAVTHDMQQMGEMILLLAQETAVAAGIQATTTIRQGRVDEQIVALCQEHDADTIVLGEPLRRLGATVFTSEQLAQLSARLRADCRASVVVEP